ncbi:MAG: hypothetical protein ACXV8T_01580 [Acidimicrobiia bacterium]
MHRIRSTVGLVAIVTAALFVVLGGCASSSARSGSHPSSTTRSREDLDVTAADFVNLHDMTPVRGFFVANRLGHLRQALAVANAPSGGTYPVGTILQLVPQEAMVKRRAGFDPKTHDWEFLFLGTDASGTTIEKRGTTDVVNRFGGNCFSCHAAARSRFDLVCEHDHGCAPLPIGDDVIRSVQAADPRPRAAG